MSDNPEHGAAGDRPAVGTPGGTERGATAAHDAPIAAPAAPGRADAETIVGREQDRYGGVKVGSAFFGWLTAVGMFVLISALLSAAGAAFGLSQSDAPIEDAAAAVTESAAETVGIISAVVLLLVLFIAYYAGGYVAGRMARFHGAKQGLAVWVWAIVIAVVLAVAGAIAGSQYDVMASTGAFPRIPVNEGDLTTAGIIAAVLALLVSLAGAVLGGKAGTNYHRKVDEAGFGHKPKLRR